MPASKEGSATGVRSNDFRRDAELVRRLQSDSPHGALAFRELVERYAPLLQARALRVVGDANDAEEVVQDAFLRVHRSIRRFRQEKPLRHWLYTITSNSARNLLRTRARERRRISEFAHQVRTEQQGGAHDPDVGNHALERALNDLEPATRMAIALRFIEGASFPEISRDLALGESAAKMRVRRGLDQLRAALGSERIGGA